MLVLGLTGNIGCGKSSVTKIFQEKGIDVVDADIISRKIFEDKDLLKEVFDYFGDGIKNDDNTLNRKALGNIVFNDSEKLIKLNSFTHPRIRNKIQYEIENIFKENKKIAVIDAALIVEGGYLEFIDKLLVITCQEEIQIERIQRRDNCSREEAISRMNSQISQSEKAKYGDYIIDNSGTLEQLKENTQKFIMYMKENWCE